jgi:hypothetical protein
MKDSFGKLVANAKHLGPGGINCVCCGPAPGKERKAYMRACRRRLKAFFYKEIRQELKE